MEKLQGQGVCQGIAFGKLSFFQREDQTITKSIVEDAKAEVARFERARAAAIQQLADLYAKATAELGEENSLLFQIHQMMLEDLDYCESITNRIEGESVNAEFSVSETAKEFSSIFSTMDDEYMRARAADVVDISRRVIRILEGKPVDGLLDTDEPVIVAADDLAPSETAQLDKSKILAFVTRKGSANSHTAIFARTMGIPAVIALGDALSEGYDGLQVAVDGGTGVLYIEPDNGTMEELEYANKELLQFKKKLESYRGRPSVSADGQKVLLYANIGNPDDLDAVLKNDAEGIGLFRSEFLYLESKDYPTEEQQFEAYKTVAERMGGKRVVIRTLDIGADKQADYFNLPHEDNPAMGLRAIRICLTRPDVFKTQLRALYRASAYGKIAIMFPMITSLDEVKQIKEIAAQVRDELKENNVDFDETVELGIMVETPASAIISDRLAREVDFFSIGTNDLTQYTLAVDRQNQSLDAFCDTHHEAVLRLIKMTIENAHKHGIWVGICGELGADTKLTDLFLAMGVDELSVSPSLVLNLRRRIHEINVARCRATLLAKLN